MVAPRTATWAWAETSASVKKLPLVTVRLFATSQPGVEPETAAVQFCAPATIGAIRCTTGATAMTSGATEWSSRASASLTVRVLAAPRPARTPPAPVVLPGTTVIRLVPSAVIRPVTYCRAPRPIPTVRMTAATPMRIPSAVSSERNRCPLTERKPVATVWKKLIRCGSVDGGGGARALGRPWGGRWRDPRPAGHRRRRGRPPGGCVAAARARSWGPAGRSGAPR